MEDMVRMANESKHMFSADRPIEKREEDQLDRAKFAESIAAAIKSWTAKDSLVVGLYGPWGSGKSSVVNMVVESLNDRKEESPVIVRFNPWQVSGQGEIVAAFFQELRPALMQIGVISPDFTEKVDKYVDYFELAARAATVVASSGAIRIDPVTETITAGSVNFLTRLWRRVKGSRKKPETVRESLSTMKESLKGFMQDLERPILVLIGEI